MTRRECSVSLSPLTKNFVRNGFGTGIRARVEEKAAAQRGSGSVTVPTGMAMLSSASSGMQVSEQASQLA